MKKMMSQVEDKSFINKLIKYCVELRQMKPRYMYIFNVFANYGSYQIIVGPEYTDEECRKFHLAPHTRKITVNGSMYHLFISPTKIAALPDQEDVKRNLKGSVIMKKIFIHIVDRDGNGSATSIDKNDRSEIYAKQRINLAGVDGIELLKKHRITGRLFNETYKIIQEDILNALKSCAK